MAEVICPSCGKENPAESTFCWFCQARLDTAPPARRNSGALRAEDTPDWLKTMRDKGEVPGRADDNSLDGLGDSENPENQPEWLARLRERKNAEEKISRMAGEDVGEETDWLKKISSDSSSSSPSVSSEEEEVPSWMQPEAPKTPEPAREVPSFLQPESTPGVEPDEEIPDWMKAETPAPTEPAQETPSFLQSEPVASVEPGDDVPDWMKAETPAPAEPVQETPSFLQSEPAASVEPGDDIPDWMKAETSAPAEPAQEVPSPLQSDTPFSSEASDDLPDWLKAEPVKPVEGSNEIPLFLQSEAPASTEPAEGVPAWMHTEVPEASSIPQEPQAGQTPAESTSEEDIPAWMQSMAASQSSEAVEPQAEPLDWLDQKPIDQDKPTKKKTPDKQNPSQAGSASASTSGDDTPDWLNDLANWKPESVKFEDIPPAQLAEAAPESSPETPGFTFDSLSEEESTPVEKPVEAEPLPDFLSGAGFTPLESSQEQAALIEETPKESFTIPDFANEFPAENTPAQPVPSPEPDWLRELEETPATPFDLNAPVKDENIPEAAPADSLPDWLSGIQAESGSPASSADEASIFVEAKTPDEAAPAPTPFAGDEMPDWLSLTSDQGSGGNLGDKVAAFGLEPAELPGWLEAMKPTESGTGSRSDQEIDNLTEQRGPLAGVNGVLPLEDLTGVYSRPPTYSTRLLISERQRAHTTLLETVLLEETTPTALPIKPAIAPLKLARIFIGILLILMLLFPLITNSHSMLLPALFPPETVALYNSIETLPENSAVLLVVDYEPGLSGEVSLSAEQVVRHLMARNARLAIISTIPTGPALAQDLISRAASIQTAYDLTNQVVNLGYLAGGTTGLQEFVQNPQTAAGYTLDLLPAWSQPALAGITSLNQFASVIVLTDNQEISRSWIEQVQPSLGGTPLFMVASAQAAPLIQPYVESGQVQGLLAGLMGSAVYEQIMLQPGNATQYWDAYQYGILAAVLLTLAGVLLQIITYLRQHGNPQAGA